MVDIITYINSFIPSQFSFITYIIAGAVCLLAIDSAFSLVVALFARFFK